MLQTYALGQFNSFYQILVQSLLSAKKHFANGDEKRIEFGQDGL